MPEYPLIRTVTSPVSLSDQDDTIIANDSSGDVIISLPPARSVVMKMYMIKKVGEGNRTIIRAAEGELIDGAPSLVISSRNDSFTLQTDGESWYIL